MPKAANPAAEIKRITDQIEKLQARRLELVAELELPAREEKIVHDSLALADEITRFLDKIDGEVTQPIMRKAIALAKRADKQAEKLEKLPGSGGKEAASEAATAAVQRLLNECFGAKA